ncbi:hypothetical protein HanIR_Chr17g0880481 [Helianthus annuus]|nr:hypothetical protein HanIR_Chr17g0880481 [Helianthus annuus]
MINNQKVKEKRKRGCCERFTGKGSVVGGTTAAVNHCHRLRRRRWLSRPSLSLSHRSLFLSLIFLSLRLVSLSLLSLSLPSHHHRTVVVVVVPVARKRGV